MTGCKLSLVTGGYPIYVIPIFSGISDLQRIAEPFDPSNWAGEEVRLGPLTLEPLKRNFATSLSIYWGTYESCFHLRSIFKGCGGYVHQILRLIEAICARTEVHDRLKLGDLGPGWAWEFYEDCLVRLQNVFGAHRWHALFTSSSPPPHTDVVAQARRRSFRTRTFKYSQADLCGLVEVSCLERRRNRYIADLAILPRYRDN